MALSLDDTRHLQAAEGWIGLGDYIEANQELDRVSPKRRVHPAALKISWQIFVAARRWTATLEIATALTKLAPADADGWLNLSFSLHELSRTAEARENLLAVLDRFPGDATMRYNLACYECQLGNLRHARDRLQQAFALRGGSELRSDAVSDPDLEPLWSQIGNL